MGASRASRLRTLPLAAAAALAVAVLGGLVTDTGPWYQALRKPAWQPPDWLFGPVWTLIYALTAASGLLAWWAARDRSRKLAIAAAFAANAVLNVGWSWLFFGVRRPDWALAEVALLWLSVAAMMVVVGRVRTLAAWLLAPYLAWVGFAAVLNLAIVRLNGPFAAGG